MKIICHFRQCKWAHITNILADVDKLVGLWQCRRCGELSLGRPLTEEERRNPVELEVLEIKRFNLSSDEVEVAFTEYIEKHHKPSIFLSGSEEITVKHKIVNGSQYVCAKVEIGPGKSKNVKKGPIELAIADAEPTDAEMEEHVKESSEVGEPIHPDQMMKDLMGKK